MALQMPFKTFAFQRLSSATPLAMSRPSPIRAIWRRRLSSTFSIPPDSWDSHMHIVDDGRFPLSSCKAYKPPFAPLSHARSFEFSLGIPNMVIVQPSIYANDNSCLLDALAKLGPSHARGVVG